MTQMATCYSSYELTAHTPVTASGGGAQSSSRPQSSAVTSVQVPQKDYSRPLHVDCSVEYELPNQAKPPAGVRNEPLLMIHPCYFRKIESQRRSPFVNNLPTRQQQSPQTQPQQATVVPTAVVSSTAKRRLVRGQQLPQQVPQQAAQYPVQYADTIQRQHQLWDPMHTLVPSQTPAYCSKRDAMLTSVVIGANVNNLGAVISGGSGATCGYVTNTADTANMLGHCWTEPDRSPDRPDESKHILTGKYRQYLRAHRLHPYVTSAIPLASAFPQIHQQVCYNV